MSFDIEAARRLTSRIKRISWSDLRSSNSVQEITETLDAACDEIERLDPGLTPAWHKEHRDLVDERDELQAKLTVATEALKFFEAHAFEYSWWGRCLERGRDALTAIGDKDNG